MSTDQIILEELAAIAPNRATEQRLQPWVNRRVLEPLTLGELRLKLGAFERKGWAAALTPALGEREWFITDGGRAVLMGAQ